MKIIFLFSILIITILLICRDFIYSAKRNLFKDQAAWSGRDIKIKYTDKKSKEISGKEEKENYLKMVADESKLYLEDHSYKEEGKTK